jgi:hypothetical protein
MHKIIRRPPRPYFQKQVVYSETEVGAVITGVNVEGKITAEHHQQQEE